jgi:hypothetical protein
MITLEVFEVLDHCTLKKWEINDIKEEINCIINVINKGIKEGRDYYLDGFIYSYCKELAGMRSICSIIGLRVKTPYVNEEEIQN